MNVNETFLKWSKVKLSYKCSSLGILTVHFCRLLTSLGVIGSSSLESSGRDEYLVFPLNGRLSVVDPYIRIASSSSDSNASSMLNLPPLAIEAECFNAQILYDCPF